MIDKNLIQDISTKFVLINKSTGFPVEVSVSKGSGNFSVSEIHTLDDDSDGEGSVWECDTRIDAINVLYNSAPRYNASYDTPNHNLNPDNYTVGIRTSISVVTYSHIKPITANELKNVPKSYLDIYHNSVKEDPEEYNAIHQIVNCVQDFISKLTKVI